MKAWAASSDPEVLFDFAVRDERAGRPKVRYDQGVLVKAINVEDLPEPVARALDTVVQSCGVDS
jgi:hypothetical protein